MLRRACRLIAVATLCSLPSVQASPAPAPASAPASPAATPGPAVADSPRASVAQFLDLARRGRHDEAAEFLDVAPAEAPRAADLARRLKAVLDRHLWIDLDAVSPAAQGDPQDGLPPDTDELGSISAAGRPEPVRLVRRAGNGRWTFSRATVDRIDAWYATLPDRWVRERLPEAFLRPGPWELLWWQWVAVLVLAGLSAAAGWVLGRLTRVVLGAFAARTQAAWDEALVHRLAGPLMLGWTLVVLYVALPTLGLYAPAEALTARVLRAAGTTVLFWAMWRAVDVGGEALRRSTWGRASASALSVVFIATRFAKVLVLAMGAVTALSALGYPVAGLLAGLGIGGVAVALAAQKTIEHLFGSVAIAVDQPFRVGDFVKVEDFVGTVEEIGLRSTRFRTLDRTLITIPNGRVADMRLESFSVRDRMRLACTVSLAYGTRADQVRQVLAGLERVLRAHPKIWPDAVVVRFKELAASSLDIEVMAWFETPVWSEFQLIRQEVLLGFMDVIERSGAAYGVPARSVRLTGDAPPPSAYNPEGGDA